jgi:hypothetical protein
MRSRRPNAGGGRNNQHRTGGAARARFSNWKPPSKRGKRPERDSKRRGAGDRGRTPSSAVVSSGADREARRPRQISVSTFGGVKVEDLEELRLPAATVDFILRAAAELDIVEGSNEADIDDFEISDADSEEDISEEILKDSGEVAALGNSLDRINFSSVAPRQMYVAAPNLAIANRFPIFVSLGFRDSEIAAVTERAASGASSTNDGDDGLLLALLQYCLGEAVAPVQSSSSSIAHTECEDLSNEVEAISSIYDDVVVSGGIYLRGKFSSVIEFTLKDPFARVKIIVHGSDRYLTPDAKVYAWILSSAAPLDTDAARRLAIAAMKYLAGLDAGSRSCYELALYIQSHRGEEDIRHLAHLSGSDRVAAAVASAPPVPLGAIREPPKAPAAPAPAVRAASLSQSAAPPPEPAAAAPAPLMPPASGAATPAKQERQFSWAQNHAKVTSFNNLPEYRSCLLSALNSGLSGLEAKAKVRNLLCLSNPNPNTFHGI